MPPNLNITKKKIDYLVRVADIVVMIVDYFTIENTEFCNFAAYSVG